MALRLETDYRASVPLEVEGIVPDQLRDKSLAEIERLSVYCGNQKAALGDFFRCTGDATDECLDWEGELSGVHWIGAGMTRGEIRAHGSVGRHVGSRMHGGRIEVRGDASDWVGGEMAGGLIQVQGNAGHMVGGAYRGSARGMTGGTILVHGDAGNEIGHAMRRGLIAIAGSAQDLIGMGMLAGSIIVFGKCGIRHGAGMRRGTIALMGDEPYAPLPTFHRACRCILQVMSLVDRKLQAHAFPSPLRLSGQLVDLYNGDFLEGGRGELLLRAG